MKQYDIRILNQLVDTYEGGSLYQGTNKVNVSIAARFTKTLIPEYFDTSSMEYDVIHAQMTALEQQGFIEIVWKKRKQGHIIEKVVLETGRLADIYELLKRIPRRTQEDGLRKLLEEYVYTAEDGFRGREAVPENGKCNGNAGSRGSEADCLRSNTRGSEAGCLRSNTHGSEADCLRSNTHGSEEVLENFAAWALARLDQGQSVQEYLDMGNLSECRTLLAAVSAVVKNHSEMYYREFSIRHFQDSKEFERISGKVVAVIRRFSGDNGVAFSGGAPAFASSGAPSTGNSAASSLSEMTKAQILEEYNLYENPSAVMLKGQAYFTLAGNDIRLEALDGGIGILSQDLDKICWLNDHPVTRVLTIENLTVFHRWSEPGTLTVYLGGYHNHVKRQFLMALYRNFPEAVYLHFGDIDCGGFWIYWDLCQKTGIPFETYKMDADILARFRKYAKPLGANDRKRLTQMMKEERFLPFAPVFEQMLAWNCKLEQECIFLE